MIKQYQNVIIIGAVIVIAFFVYTYFFTGKATPILDEQAVSQAAPADQDLISLLLELKAITLDESLLSDAAFTSLQDFSKELVPEAIGRPNPFAPLGAQAKAPGNQTTAQ
jgi:hypothetical protein